MELKNWTCKIFFDPWFQYITSEEARMLNGRGMSHTRIFTLFNCLVPKFNHPYRYICKTSINRAVLWIRLMRVYVTLLLSQPSLALLLRELVTRKWSLVAITMAWCKPVSALLDARYERGTVSEVICGLIFVLNRPDYSQYVNAS